MPTVELFRSLPQALAAGQVREFTEGSPGFVTDGTFHSVSVCPRAQLGKDITLVSVTVRTDKSATPRLHYTVKNNNPNQAVEFIRTSVRISL